MVQIIEENRKRTPSENFATAFQGLLSQGNQFMESKKAKEQLQQENEVAKQMGFDLSGITDPKTRQQMFGLAMQGLNQQQLEGKKNSNNQENQNRLFNHQKEIESLKQQGKTNKQEENPVALLQSGLSAIDRMRNLREKGNLGRGSSVLGFFGGETAKDRGEYETLGNSLIQYASNIPIRNRQEFEKLAGHLSDPSTTDSEAEGILNALQNIIKGSMSQYEQPESFEKESSEFSKPKENKNRPPLSSFHR